MLPPGLSNHAASPMEYCPTSEPFVLFRICDCPNSLCASFAGRGVQYTSYERTTDDLECNIVMGILLAAELGFLLFLGENLIAIFLGIPQIIVIGGILWLTHDLLAERRS